MSSDELRALGVEYVRFYTYTTPVVNNIFTACILIDEDKNLLARGVSICSIYDSYKKKSGKNRAFGRAVSALRNEHCDLPISLIATKIRQGKKVTTERWEDGKVQKTFKIKSRKELNYFRKEIVPILKDFGEGYRYHKLYTKDGKEVKKAHFSLPIIYPVMITSEFFDYKSEYEPKPIYIEKDIIAGLE